MGLDEDVKLERFNSIASDHGYDEIEDRDDPKHDTIKDYDLFVYRSPWFLKPLRSSTVKEDEKVSVTLCYVLWQNPLYVKLLYISILSQLLYTDVINLERIKIYTGEELQELVWDVFSPFTEDGGEGSLDFEVEIESLGNKEYMYSNVANNVLQPKRLNKYVTSLEKDIREDDLLVISDCESFTFGNELDVYSKIHSSYLEHEDFPVLGCRTQNQNVFLKRRKDLAGMFFNDDEYINWAIRRLNVSKEEFIEKIVKLNHWFLTCWFVFDNQKVWIKKYTQFVKLLYASGV